MNFTFGRLSYFVIKDPNGNMTADLDRGIVAIRYNLLNLPDTVQFENGNRIVYFYYAGGERAGAVTTTYSTPISVPLDSVYLGEDPHFDMWEHRHGNLFYKMGSPSRLLFDDGFFELAERHGGLISQIPYVFVRDHLGSVRLVCNGNTGEVVQSLEYLPSGVIFRSRNFDRQPYRFTGKKLLSAHGLDWYDSGARMQEFHIPRFTTMDPLCEKYYSISPYAYCNNNPVNYVDPDGRKVEADKLSQKNISNTLTKQEVKFLRFDKSGVLDIRRLNKSKSFSENMTALKALANSEVVYSFQVKDKDHAGFAYYDNSSTGGNFYRGTTEMPNAESNPSPDNKVYVLVGKNLNEKQQVMTTAHEAFGHAYFYEVYRNVVKASHTYKPEVRVIWDEELHMNIFEITKVPTNLILENQIKTVVKQAENNYEEEENP